jgi:hypothetical protein
MVHHAHVLERGMNESGIIHQYPRVGRHPAKRHQYNMPAVCLFLGNQHPPERFNGLL